MLTPPFKLRAGGLAALVNGGPAVARGTAADACCEVGESAEASAEAAPASSRSKLHQLDSHLHCSVIGTCLGTAELRRLMARHLDVQGADDLEVHHLAVSHAALGGAVAKALHKALDQRHAGALRTFAEAHDAAALQAAWQQAWCQGEIPGAYWALLTHKALTPALRQNAFGEVHMLSHLMGSANRDELKRFVALEQENARLHERLEREQQRRTEALHERDQLADQLRKQALDFERRLAEALASARPAVPAAEASSWPCRHSGVSVPSGRSRKRRHWRCAWRPNWSACSRMAPRWPRSWWRPSPNCSN